MHKWLCRHCNEMHDGLTLHYGSEAPDMYYAIPENERQKRVLISSDMCLIDNTHAFIIGNLDIVIKGEKKPFSWDVWVALSLEHFHRTAELWLTSGRESEPPYEGLIATSLPCYPNTIGLKAKLITRMVGFRPKVELIDSEHPLAIEQKDSITMERVQEIAEVMMHRP